MLRKLFFADYRMGLAIVLAFMLSACGENSTDAPSLSSPPTDDGSSPLPGDQTPSSGSATVRWALNTEPDVAGYRVYYGTTPNSYLQSKGQGIAVAGTSHTVTGLASGIRYYFAVTAFDNASNESGYSTEVFKDIP